jgi:hypothetical protein
MTSAAQRASAVDAEHTATTVPLLLGRATTTPLGPE